MRDLGTSAAARALGVSAQSVRNMAQDGRLPYYRLPTGHRRFRMADVVAARKEREPDWPQEAPSYHDLFITTDTIARTSIFHLPYGIEVTCTRVRGWQVRDHNQMVPPPRLLPNLPAEPKRIAGEYDRDPETGLGGLRLDVAGHVICDSLTRPKDD